MLPPTPSSLLTFVQTWLDEYSEDFRDPSLHPALLLLLDHLRISAAVYGDMHSQPNFCSLASQAEELLERFYKEGDHSPHDMPFLHHGFSAQPCSQCCWEWCENPIKVLTFSLFLVCVSYVASKVDSAAADLEQDEEGLADEDSECESSLDQGSIMDFSATAIAEQLTRIDSVC